MEAVIGLVSAIIGLITAIINKKRIVELRYSHGESGGKQPVTIGKRFKRAILLSIVGIFIIGFFANSEVKEIAQVLAFVFLFLVGYQVMGMLLLIWAKLWR